MIPEVTAPPRQVVLQSYPVRRRTGLWLAIGAAVVSLVLIASLMAPVVTEYFDGDRVAIREWFDNNLHDPNYKVIDWKGPVEAGDLRVYTIRIRAANGFGMKAYHWLEIGINDDGDIFRID